MIALLISTVYVSCITFSVFDILYLKLAKPSGIAIALGCGIVSMVYPSGMVRLTLNLS